MDYAVRSAKNPDDPSHIKVYVQEEGRWHLLLELKGPMAMVAAGTFIKHKEEKEDPIKIALDHLDESAGGVIRIG